MAVPKRRKSRSKSRMRRSHDALRLNSLVICKNCGVSIVPHRVCPECGWYKDRIVIAPRVKVPASEKVSAS